MNQYNKLKLHITLPALLLIYSLSLHAQTGPNNIKAGDEFYAKGDYYSASKYYEKYFNAGKSTTPTTGDKPYVVQQVKSSPQASSRSQAAYNLAESYRLLNYYEKAAPFYAVAATYGTTYPLANYWYGICLRESEQYDSSLTIFNQFLKSYSTHDLYQANAQKEIANLSFIHEQLAKAPTYITIKSSSKINQEGATYAPTWQGNKLVITSTKNAEATGQDKPHPNKLYFADSTGLKKIGVPNPDNLQYGAASFTADGKKAFFTRWSVVKGQNISAIYSSDLKDTVWSAPKMLDKNVNVKGYSARQPFVTPDGQTLFFSSNMPNGKGQFDIYSVALNSTAAPVNLGSNINTAGDDEAPFYNGKLLVFATNGRVGMGGFDLFYSAGTPGAWTAPVNFGAPVNSVKDDIYFTAKGPGLSNIYISSDRSSACCLELFAVQKINTNKYFGGLVTDCSTGTIIPGATITISEDADASAFFTLVSASTGQYGTFIPNYKQFTAKVSKAGYHDGSLSFYQPGYPDADSLTNPDVCLTPISPDSLVVTTTNTIETILNTVYFDFDKAVLTKEGHNILDSLVQTMITRPNIIVHMDGNTDGKGSNGYNADLSLKRVKSCFDYLVSKGVKAERLQLKASSKDNPAAPNTIEGKDNPPGRKLNRRVEFSIAEQKK